MKTVPPVAHAHEAQIRDQFTRQAEIFAAAPELHNEEAVALLVDAAAPGPTDLTLDVACGPGSIAVAMAKRARLATGLDATPAMLNQARDLADEQGISNVTWRKGDVYALPFEGGSFDIVTCRFAFHHFIHPQVALSEMIRVCRPGGMILVCDAVASDDQAKADAFNRMERLRDPSTVQFHPLRALLDLFATAGLPPPAQKFFQVPTEREEMVTRAFPANDDFAGLRRLIDAAAEGDLMAMNARRSGGTVLLAYQAVILTVRKPG
jgi:ubiquinone/menaquinone biosynthesis C-methylase UbiE